MKSKFICEYCGKINKKKYKKETRKYCGINCYLLEKKAYRDWRENIYPNELRLMMGERK